MFWNFSALHKKDHGAAHHSTKAGFGLVELLVSISILVMVMATILVQQQAFNGAVLLRSQAFEVALQAREVQLSAVSAVGASAGDFRSVLGLHFDVDTPSQYLIFEDANDNNFWNSGEEYGSQGRLDNRFEIGDIRTVNGATETPVNNLSVVFERPNFDARFYDSTGEINVPAIEIDVVRVGASGTGLGSVRTVEITSTGQISVQ
jgi:type II secretory pathway pseudopilin PulG